MDKIYKDYEDQYIANNIVYAPTLDSEYKLIHEKKSWLRFCVGGALY